MNKYQEALKTFKKIVDNEAYTDKFQDHCKIAVELIEKATPKKPIQLSDSRRHKCPNCNCQLPFKKNVLKKQNPRIYCDRCGQRIDWSEEE